MGKFSDSAADLARMARHGGVLDIIPDFGRIISLPLFGIYLGGNCICNIMHGVAHGLKCLQ